MKVLSPLIIFCFLLNPCGAESQDLGSWESLAPMCIPRLEQAAGLLDGKIYVAGGFIENPLGGTVGTNSVERYDPVTNLWEPLNDLPSPDPLNHFQLVTAAGCLYAIGGLRVNFTPTDRVYRYDPIMDMWTERAPLLEPVGAYGAAVVDDMIYISGGFPPESRGSELRRYDPEANEWTMLPSMDFGREHHTSAAIDGKVYVFGGRRRFLDTFEPHTECFDPQAGPMGEWTTVADIPTERAGLTCAAVNGRAYVFGGERSRSPMYPDGVHPEVEEYNPLTNSWQAMTPMPTPRHGFAAVALDGKIYLPAGGPIVAFTVSNILDVFTPPALTPLSGVSGFLLR